MSGLENNAPERVAYELGLALLRAGRIEEGIEKLRMISERWPKALADIAWAYHSRGEADLALPYLERYLEVFPDDAGGWLLLARIARSRNDLERAERHARRAVRLRPKDARLWFELAEILFYRQRWAAAARAYRRCLKLDPNFTRAEVRGLFSARKARDKRIRAITWRPPVGAVLRRIVTSDLFCVLLEQCFGVALDDRRWLGALNWGRAASCVGNDAQYDTQRKSARPDSASFAQWFAGLDLDGRMNRALEIGVGPSDVARAIASRGWELLSLVPGEMARRERERSGIRAVRCDFHFIPDRGGAYDLIVSNHALAASRSPLFALWEWKRLLRPDGYLVVLARLAADRPPPAIEKAARSDAGCAVPPGGDAPVDEVSLRHSPYGVPGKIFTLTYWQLRWLFKQTGFQLLAETLEDPRSRRLESVAHVDGRLAPQPSRPWIAYFLLRKPGQLPYDGALEKPRPLAASRTN